MLYTAFGEALIDRVLDTGPSSQFWNTQRVSVPPCGDATAIVQTVPFVHASDAGVV
jgi:hypothetical protein